MLKNQDPLKVYKNHGLSKVNPRLYRIWKGMRSRCNIPSASGYKNYGGRGIRICNEWDNYAEFFGWAIRNGYNDSLTLERIEVDGDYEPHNCKWITREEQKFNTRNSLKTVVNGELLSLAEISKKYSINYGTLFSRYKNGDRDELLIRPNEKETKITIGDEEITLKEAAKNFNLSYSTILRRFHQGYRDEKLIKRR